jgi:imidazolonepropionase-like amidohydrolase
MWRVIRVSLFSLVLMISILLLLFFIGVFWPLSNLGASKNDNPIVIHQVKILHVDSGEVSGPQNIVVRGSHITQISEQDIYVEGAVIVDGSGLFAMPSLWDMHTHALKFSPDLSMPLYIRYGITNVRDPLSCPRQGDPIIACPEDQRAWTAAAENGELVGPRFWGITSFMLNGPRIHHYVKDLPEYFGVKDAQQAKAFVQHYAGRVDAIKVYNYIPPEAYFTLAEEAKKVGLDIVGHRPHAVSALDAAVFQKSIEHARFILHEAHADAAAMRSAAVRGDWQENRRSLLDNFDEAKANEIFDFMIEHDTWYTPTHLTRWVDAYGEEDFVRHHSDTRYLHPLVRFQWLEDIDKVIARDPSPQARNDYREFYQKGLDITGMAHERGVKILAGSDYYPNAPSLHEELKQLVLAGLSPAEALRTATLNPAEYFELQDQYGAVKEGMVADFLLLRENPFEDIANTRSIETVVFNGALYDLEKLSEIDRHVESRANSFAITCKLVWEFLKSPVNY